MGNQKNQNVFFDSLEYSRKNTIKDLIKVSVSNLLIILSGVLISILLPKVMSGEDYGFYKTFTLYITYIGLLGFGFSEGVYLIYGGKNYDQLDKKQFRFFSKFIIISQLTISIIVFIFSIVFINGENQFILLCLAIFAFSKNISSYFYNISQITRRFNDLSIKNSIQSILLSVAVLVYYIIFKYKNELLSYRPFTIVYIVIYSTMLLWYIFSFKDIIFGSSTSFKIEAKNIKEIVWRGIPLMISSLISTLLLIVDRQVVNIFFSKEEYGIYAFSYSMLALITTATSAISTVIYPSLKREKEETLVTSYSLMNSIILIFVAACLIVFFPLVLFVSWFLPAYEASLDIYRIIFPGLLISCSITLIKHNYYKVLGKNNVFFIQSIIILIVSFSANLLAYYLFKNTLAISISSVLVLFVWYLIVEFYFVHKYKIKMGKNLLYLILIIVLFYGATAIENFLLSLIFYFLSYVLLTILLYRKEISFFINKVIKKC